MRYVRINNDGKVVEILPSNMASLQIIERWYGHDFAANCVLSLSDDIVEGKYYINGQFIDYTETEMYRIEEAKKRMHQIKIRLAELDWQAAKYIDGEINSEDYEPFKTERISLRAEYENLQARYGDDD